MTSFLGLPRSVWNELPQFWQAVTGLGNVKTSSLLDLPGIIWYELLQCWLPVKGLARLIVASGSHHARKQLQSILSTNTFVLTECIAVEDEKSVALVEWLNNNSARVKSIAIHRTIEPHVAVPFFRRIGPSLEHFELSNSLSMRRSALASTISIAAVNCISLKSLTLRNLADEAESVATFLLATQHTLEKLSLVDSGDHIGRFLGKDSLPLKHLAIDHSLRDKDVCKVLSLSPKLAALQLSRGRYPLAVAAAMAMASLRSLKLHALPNNSATSNYAAAFGVANNLQSVDLDDVYEITDNSIVLLVQSANQLDSVRIYCCHCLSDASLQAVGEQCGARLRRFEIGRYDNSSITDIGLSHIVKNCKNLECLSVPTWSQYNKLNFAKVLKRVPQLRFFDASGGVIDVAFLHKLPVSMPNLNYLAISVSSSTSLAELRQTVRSFPNLVTLWVAVDAAEGCRFFRDALSALLPQVKVVLKHQMISLWKGEPGMTSPSHKLPYQWDMLQDV